MAFVHGKDSVIKIDNAGGTLTDISSYVNNVDFPITADVAETTVMGDDNKTYIVGLKDATLSITGLWDSTIDGILGQIVGQSSTVSFELSPEGTTGGNIKYEGEAICTEYSQNPPVADVVSYTASFKVTGAVTRGTH